MQWASLVPKILETSFWNEKSPGHPGLFCFDIELVKFTCGPVSPRPDLLNPSWIEGNRPYLSYKMMMPDQLLI